MSEWQDKYSKAMEPFGLSKNVPFGGRLSFFIHFNYTLTLEVIRMKNKITIDYGDFVLF